MGRHGASAHETSSRIAIHTVSVSYCVFSTLQLHLCMHVYLDNGERASGGERIAEDLLTRLFCTHIDAKFYIDFNIFGAEGV